MNSIPSDSSLDQIPKDPSKYLDPSTPAGAREKFG
jgi:hypothetical protein